MKKILLCLIAMILFAGCSSQSDDTVSMPKLKAVDVTIDVDQKLESLDYDDLLDTNRVHYEEIKELEKNGSIDYPNYSTDENGNILPGVYTVKISYYTDVVESKVTVKDSQAPYFNDVDSVDVPVGQTWFDFSSIIYATSPIGNALSYTYDTQYINWEVVDTYPMTVTVTDSEGRTVSKEISVNII